MNPSDILLKGSVLGFSLGLFSFVFLACATVWLRRNVMRWSILGILGHACFWTIPVAGSVLAYGLIREATFDRVGMISALGISPVYRPESLHFMTLTPKADVKAGDSVANFIDPETVAQVDVLLKQREVLTAQVTQVASFTPTPDSDLEGALADLNGRLAQAKAVLIHVQSQIALLQAEQNANRLLSEDQGAESTVPVVDHTAKMLDLLNEVLAQNQDADAPGVTRRQSRQERERLALDLDNLVQDQLALERVIEGLQQQRKIYEIAAQQDRALADRAQEQEQAVLSRRIEWLDAQMAALKEEHIVRAPFDAAVIYRAEGLQPGAAGQLVLALQSKTDVGDSSGHFLVQVVLPQRTASEMQNQEDKVHFDFLSEIEEKGFLASYIGAERLEGRPQHRLVSFLATLSAGQIAFVLGSANTVQVELTETTTVWLVPWIKWSGRIFAGAIAGLCLFWLIIVLMSRLAGTSAAARKDHRPQSSLRGEPLTDEENDEAQTQTYKDAALAAQQTQVLSSRDDQRIKALAIHFKLSLEAGTLDPSLLPALDWSLDRHPSTWQAIQTLASVFADDLPRLRAQLDAIELTPGVRRRALAFLSFAETPQDWPTPTRRQVAAKSEASDVGSLKLKVTPPPSIEAKQRG